MFWETRFGESSFCQSWTRQIDMNMIKINYTFTNCVSRVVYAHLWVMCKDKKKNFTKPKKERNKFSVLKIK